MTRQKQLKKLIRDRMAKTGESYTSARRHIVNSTPARDYVLTGGVHPDTSCVASRCSGRPRTQRRGGRCSRTAAACSGPSCQSEGVDSAGAEGGNLRALYADFLAEAAPIVALPALEEVAAAHRDLAGRWNALAGMAVDEAVPGLRQAAERAPGSTTLSHAEAMPGAVRRPRRRRSCGPSVTSTSATSRWMPPPCRLCSDELHARLLRIFEAEVAANRQLAGMGM